MANLKVSATRETIKQRQKRAREYNCIAGNVSSETIKLVQKSKKTNKH